jgi:hypothetical protein
MMMGAQIAIPEHLYDMLKEKFLDLDRPGVADRTAQEVEELIAF